jgi:hypothetical protein
VVTVKTKHYIHILTTLQQQYIFMPELKGKIISASLRAGKKNVKFKYT